MTGSSTVVNNILDELAPIYRDYCLGKKKDYWLQDINHIRVKKREPSSLHRGSNLLFVSMLW